MGGTKQTRIVAETTKNWTADQYGAGFLDTISHRFKKIIEYNAECGYDLESWQYQQSAYELEFTWRE